MELEDLEMPPEKTVYRIDNKDIAASGRKQCKMEDHIWNKLSENEVICNKCMTALIIDPKKMKEYGC